MNDLQIRRSRGLLHPVEGFGLRTPPRPPKLEVVMNRPTEPDAPRFVMPKDCRVELTDCQIVSELVDGEWVRARVAAEPQSAPRPDMAQLPETPAATGPRWRAIGALICIVYVALTIIAIVSLI